LRYHFDGDLAEVLKRALSTNQIEKVTRYLGEEYRIDLKQASPGLFNP
jgi:hypothetical protein